jgi:hypothetical protein
VRNAEEMFSFGPNPKKEKNAWSSSTCLLYAWGVFTLLRLRVL